MEMTSRQRIATTLNHQEPDRVPYDLSGTTVTAICKGAFIRAMKERGLSNSGSKVFIYNDETLIFEDSVEGKANFFSMNMQYVMGNNPPSETKYFDVSIVSNNSSEVLVYKNTIVVPGKLNTGHIVQFQILFPTIADKASIAEGYRIVFSADTAASEGLPDNIGVKIVDITRISY